MRRIGLGIAAVTLAIGVSFSRGPNGSPRLAAATMPLLAQAQNPPDQTQPLPDKPQTTPIPQPPTAPIAQPPVHRIHDVDAAATRPAPPPFIIGVWFQPVDSFRVWKARGINTLVGYESQSNHVSLDDWSDAAADAELFMIRKPAPDIIDDAKRPYLLGWLHHDEPDVRKPPVNPDDLGDDYAAWKRIDKTKPVFLNVSGGNVLFNKVPRDTYRAYAKSADWIGNDFYPVTGWNRPDWITKVGQAVDELRDLSGGKPQIAFIETSNQHLSWLPPEARGPTAGEVRAEIWDAVIHGARGIVYFPQQMGNGFQYDASPFDVNAEMTKQDGILTSLGPVLAGAQNPAPISVSVAAPLEAGWRKGSDGVITLIVLNVSDKSQPQQEIKLGHIPLGTFKLFHEGGRTLDAYGSSLIDDFAPFQVHLYQIKLK